MRRPNSRDFLALSIGLILAAITANVKAQSAPESRAESRPSTTAPWYVTRVEQAAAAEGWVGLSLAIVRDGKVAFTHHVGFEDREAKIPTSKDTRYRWASISKPVTAVAALQLVEQNRLNLDDDIRTLVPEFPEKPWKITCRQLLGHLGGVVHYSNGQVIALPRPTTPLHPYEDVVRALDTFKNSPLICEPGTKYAYTTHGYMLAGAVIQKAGGAPYWSQVKSRIAEPAGMASFEPDYQWVAIPHRAVGYKKSNRGVVRSGDTDVSWKLPGGGFISNIEDLGKFGLGLIQVKLLKPESWAAMRTPQKNRDGKVSTYGLGIGLQTHENHQICAHSGSQEKTATYLALAPERGIAVALMCNTEGAKLGPLVDELMKGLLRAP